MPDRAQVDTGDLWHWVDRLTRSRREKIIRDSPDHRPGRTEYVDIPPLWTQLLDDITATSSGGSTRAATSGSRLPLNLESLALLVEVTHYVADELTRRGQQLRLEAEEPAPTQPAPALRLVDDAGQPLLDPDLAGRLTERAARAAADHQHRTDAAVIRHDTVSDLRRLAAVVVTERSQPAVDRLARAYRRFAARIETTVTGDDESLDLHAVRHSACPACLAMWVVSDRDGETIREPALVVALQDGHVRHVTCRACGAGWWRGEDIQDLTDRMAHNEAVYGDARLWAETKPRRMEA